VRRLTLALLLVTARAWAHDVSVDVSGTLTTTSANNPRAGAFGLGASGAYDVDERWSVTGTLLYTRDLATRTPESFSPGSDVFLLSLGVMWLPTDALMTMLSVTGSPPATQKNATTVTTSQGRSADAVIDSRAWSLGATWNGLWSSGVHTVDVGLGVNRFSVFQRLDVPNTVRGRLLEASCEAGARFAVCALVGGVSSPLWQGRFSAGYTATLFRDTDVGLDAAYFVYDAPPSSVGYFSLLAFGRAELGSGVPVLPLQLSLKPRVAQRFGPVTVKLTYQAGLYTERLGVLHAVTVKTSWKVTPTWRVSLTLTGQLDAHGGAVSNPGAQALLGVLAVW
jgi:hypothetical protein